MSVNPNLTEVIAVLDASASMGPLIKSVTEGINAFANEQKDQPGECFITVYTFDGDPLVRNRQRRSFLTFPPPEEPSRLKDSDASDPLRSSDDSSFTVSNSTTDGSN